MFGDVLRFLSEHREVIGVELQAHGHTGDIDRPLRYEIIDATKKQYVQLYNRL